MCTHAALRAALCSAFVARVIPCLCRCAYPTEHAEVGLIPRICRSLFDRIHTAEAASASAESGSSSLRLYRVEVSYIEIYMESVRDLLNSNNSTLRVRRRSSCSCCGW